MNDKPRLVNGSGCSLTMGMSSSSPYNIFRRVRFFKDSAFLEALASATEDPYRLQNCCIMQLKSVTSPLVAFAA